MNVRIRFRKSFESYAQGDSYSLPDDIADIYLKAGVAEVVDRIPPVEAEAEVKASKPPEDDEPAKATNDDGDAEPKADKPKSKRK